MVVEVIASVAVKVVHPCTTRPLSLMASPRGPNVRVQEWAKESTDEDQSTPNAAAPVEHVPEKVREEASGREQLAADGFTCRQGN